MAIYKGTTPIGGNVIVSGEYSTEEKVVGTWINGKPIYRKCVHIASTTITASGAVINTGINNVETAVKAFAYQANGGGASVYWGPSKSKFFCAEGVDAVLFVLEYTKTTD